MKKWAHILLWPLFALAVISAALPARPSATAESALLRFRRDATLFAHSARALQESVAVLDSSRTSWEQARTALIQCRSAYKRIEAFMEYFFEYPVNLYNRAPVYEVEEPYMEYQSPVGMQYIETLLLAEDPLAGKQELLDQCEVLAATAADIPATLYGLQPTDAQILESERLELIRIITLGITGYDAPGLKTGIAESAVALSSLGESLEPFLVRHAGPAADSVRRYRRLASQLLESAPLFDDFDRLGFLTSAALPLQQALGSFIRSSGYDTSSHPALRHGAPHLFSPGAIDPSAFTPAPEGANAAALAGLGRQLFYEKGLSGNGRRSCASCHRPDKAFTDGLARNRSLDGHSRLARNAPSLYYAAFQHIQFHDGRATNLAEQMKAVLQNPQEMAGHPDSAAAFINRSAGYRRQFAEAFPQREQATISIDEAAAALAAFEATLAPFSSPFDRYMQGQQAALSPAQQRGFNLFMGKAQCGTCHFAPLFNGLLPPFYAVTELEVLGVPANGSLRRPKADTDSGRFGFFRIEFNRGAFKTGTVRNSARTAPYMHNGAFASLEEVVEFYNRGGGNGIGLRNPQQTLSDQPLHLSKKEVADIVAFLHALSDAPEAYPAPAH